MVARRSPPQTTCLWPRYWLRPSVGNQATETKGGAPFHERAVRRGKARSVASSLRWVDPREREMKPDGEVSPAAQRSVSIGSSSRRARSCAFLIA
jgi:hypothetical protein